MRIIKAIAALIFAAAVGISVILEKEEGKELKI